MLAVKAKPFLRWAGGKRWLLKNLDKLIDQVNFTSFHEPFIGGGSVFFHLCTNDAFISDSNIDLINTYIQVRDHVNDVIALLKEFENTEDFYYRIRNHKFSDDISEAAKFIFLNQTSFNGIYRVNLKGEYNVPYGRRAGQRIDFDNLILSSSKLKNTTIRNIDFYLSIDNVKAGDLVFLDPPYTVAHNKNGFIKYNQKIFSLEDQRRLKHFIEAIKEIGAYYVMTNAAHDAVKDLFSNGDRMFEMQRASLVGGKNAKRDRYSELILTNVV